MDVLMKKEGQKSCDTLPLKKKSLLIILPHCLRFASAYVALDLILYTMGLFQS
jgi:hypothetical protein